MATPAGGVFPAGVGSPLRNPAASLERATDLIVVPVPVPNSASRWRSLGAGC